MLVHMKTIPISFIENSMSRLCALVKRTNTHPHTKKPHLFHTLFVDLQACIPWFDLLTGGLENDHTTLSRCNSCNE